MHLPQGNEVIKKKNKIKNQVKQKVFPTGSSPLSAFSN